MASSSKVKKCDVQRKTRAAVSSSMTDLIGGPEELPIADLPTKRSVMKAMLMERVADTRDVRHIPVMELAGKVGRKVTSKWLEINHKMRNVMVKQQEVDRKVFTLWQELTEVTSKKKIKGTKRKKKGQKEKTKEDFLASLDKLFDICSCHCPILNCSEFTCSEVCKENVHIQCSCPAASKIPRLELEFMLDQRTKTDVHGKMQIGSKDCVESGRQERAQAREVLLQERKKCWEEKIAAEVSEHVEKRKIFEKQEEDLEEKGEPELEEGVEMDWDKEQDEYLPPGASISKGGSTSDSGKWSGAQNREHFPRTVMAGMRGGVSQRTLANILSSYAVDLGLATKEDPRLLVDHRKVSREQEKQMARVKVNAEEWLRTSGLSAIQMDGKDEVAKAWVTLECGTKVVRHVKEDHITLTDAEGEFLMHFTRDKVDGVKPARVIATRIITFLKLFGLDATLKMIGADSTNLNTGCKEGAIVVLERLLGRRLVWSICLLHTNELPLRHLIEELDGKTGSNNSFTGPAGRLLAGVQNLPHNPNFTPLSVGEPLPELPPEVVSDLSWDQQFGYKILKALESGVIPPSLLRMVIGKVDHSRWLTTANR